MSGIDANKLDPDTSSLSFLRNDIAAEQDVHRGADARISNFKERFNPGFLNLKVKVPLQIEKVFKGVETIEYMYEFVDSSRIQLVDLTSGAVIHTILTAEYENFCFDNCTDKLVFVFGREAFRTRSKTEQAKRYKDSVLKGDRFVENSTLRDLRGKYFDHQVKYGVNFVFIDGPEHLHSQLKSLMSIGKDEGEYIPRTKRFGGDQKTEYLINLLGSIPGVSQETSSAIVGRFPNMQSLTDALQDEQLFTSIQVVDKNGGYRRITEKVYNRIYRAFYSENGDEKL